MLNSANGVSWEAASLNSVHDVVEQRRAHSRLLDKVPDAQYQWKVLPNGIGIIYALAAHRRMRVEAVSLSYSIDQAVRDLREGVPPTLNSWKRIYCEACEKYLSSGHVVEHEVVNNEVSWISSRAEALSVAGLAKIIVPISSRETHLRTEVDEILDEMATLEQRCFDLTDELASTRETIAATEGKGSPLFVDLVRVCATSVVLETDKRLKEACDKVTATYPTRPRFVVGAIGPTNRTGSIFPYVEDAGFRNVTFDEMVFELNYLLLSRDILTYGLI